MAQWFPNDQEEWLRDVLPQAKRAFEELVKLHCDPTVLKRLLVLLRRSSMSLPSGSEIQFFIQDSHEEMLKGMSAKQAKRNLAKALTALGRIREAMLPFAGARIWRGLLSPEPDLQEICDYLEASIQALKARLAEIGPQKTPAFEWRVIAVIKYVRKSTDGYQDDWLSELLSAASPPGYPKFPTGDALRKWRSVRGLVDAPENRESDSKFRDS